MFADLFFHRPLMPAERLFTELMRLMDRSVSATGTEVPVSVEAIGNDYLLTVFVPGCRAEDIGVSVEESEVTITAKRQVAIPEEDANGVLWHRRERTSSEWRRNIALPGAVDSRSARAELHDGVLTLTISRVRAQEPRTITVTPSATPSLAGAKS